jgi:hypothetical protein
VLQAFPEEIILLVSEALKVVQQLALDDELSQAARVLQPMAKSRAATLGQGTAAWPQPSSHANSHPQQADGGVMWQASSEPGHGPESGFQRILSSGATGVATGILNRSTSKDLKTAADGVTALGQG